MALFPYGRHIGRTFFFFLQKKHEFEVFKKIVIFEFQNVTFNLMLRFWCQTEFSYWHFGTDVHHLLSKTMFCVHAHGGSFLQTKGRFCILLTCLQKAHCNKRNGELWGCGSVQSRITCHSDNVPSRKSEKIGKLIALLGRHNFIASPEANRGCHKRRLKKYNTHCSPKLCTDSGFIFCPEWILSGTYKQYIHSLNQQIVDLFGHCDFRSVKCLQCTKGGNLSCLSEWLLFPVLKRKSP